MIRRRRILLALMIDPPRSLRPQCGSSNSRGLRGYFVLSQLLGQATGLLAAMQEIAQDPVALRPTVLTGHVMVAAERRFVGERGPTDGAEAHGPSPLVVTNTRRERWFRRAAEVRLVSGGRRPIRRCGHPV